jgi:hypothetical protein
MKMFENFERMYHAGIDNYRNLKKFTPNKTLMNEVRILKFPTLWHTEAKMVLKIKKYKL